MSRPEGDQGKGSNTENRAVAEVESALKADQDHPKSTDAALP